MHPCHRRLHCPHICRCGIPAAAAAVAQKKNMGNRFSFLYLVEQHLPPILAAVLVAVSSILAAVVVDRIVANWMDLYIARYQHYYHLPVGECCCTWAAHSIAVVGGVVGLVVVHLLECKGSQDAVVVRLAVAVIVGWPVLVMVVMGAVPVFSSE